MGVRDIGQVQCSESIGSWEQTSRGDSGARSIWECDRELVSRRIDCEPTCEPIPQFSVDGICELDDDRLEYWTLADCCHAIRAHIVRGNGVEIGELDGLHGCSRHWQKLAGSTDGGGENRQRDQLSFVLDTNAVECGSWEHSYLERSPNLTQHMWI